MNNKRQPIRIDKGIFVWYEYPPYTLMLGFNDQTEEYTFRSLSEIKQYIKIFNQLKEWVEKTEKKKRK